MGRPAAVVLADWTAQPGSKPEIATTSKEEKMTQYNHNKAQVQVVVTLEDGISETHVGADKAHIDPNTRALYVMAGTNKVAVYAHGHWQSAVTS